jgi:hypothetical protein
LSFAVVHITSTVGIVASIYIELLPVSLRAYGLWSRARCRFATCEWPREEASTFTQVHVGVQSCLYFRNYVHHAFQFLVQSVYLVDLK